MRNRAEASVVLLVSCLFLDACGGSSRRGGQDAGTTPDGYVVGNPSSQDMLSGNPVEVAVMAADTLRAGPAADSNVDSRDALSSGPVEVSATGIDSLVSNPSEGGGGCVTIAGTYTGSEAITATTCKSIRTGPVVPSAILTITQAAGSCSFTMTNSLTSDVVYPGTIDPTTNTMTWNSSPFTYAYYGGYVRIAKVDMQITPKPAPQVASLDGSFDWAFGYTQFGMEICSGTTSLTGYVQ